MSRTNNWIRLFLAITIALVSTLAIAADFTMSIPADGNGDALSDGDRETRVAAAIASQGLPVQPGNTIDVTFGDGWKQSFQVTGTSNVITVQAQAGTLVRPPPVVNAGGSGGGGTGCTSGYYQPHYVTEWVCTLGECSTQSVIDRYEWVPGTCG